MRKKRAPVRKPPIVLTLNNMKKHLLNISNVQPNVINRPRARAWGTIGSGNVKSSLVSSTVVNRSSSMENSPPKLPNKEARLIHKLIDFQKQAKISEILRNKKATTFHRVSKPRTQTKLHTQFARRPLKLILVDPYTGKIINKRVRSVRFESKFQVPDHHGRSKKEFRKKK